MKVLCAVALFVAVVAAQSGDFEEIRPDAGGPGNPGLQGNSGRLGRRPGRPEGNRGDSGREVSESGRPGGRPERPERPEGNRGDGGREVSESGRPGRRPERPEGNRGDGGREVSESGQPGRPRRPGRPRHLEHESVNDALAVRHHGPGGQQSRHPFHITDDIEFSSIFKIDSVTFQNSTAVPLKEGENLFIQRRGRRNRCKQYLKLTYNSTEPNQICLEFGEVKPFLPVFNVENLTFENTTSVQLKEGKNLFFKVKAPSNDRARRRPPVGKQYVKLNYKIAEPNQVSLEYGVVKSTNA